MYDYEHIDSYIRYSRCLEKKAAKNYICGITGKFIPKGSYYYEITCWNPVRNRRFTFKLSLDVPRNIRRELRTNPENYRHAQFIQTLGFFK